MSADESSLRLHLGIPDDAERVIVFTESSHWDPDWLWTSERYYRRLVERNLDLAIEALRAEPRRVYSVECVFFLRMFWERRPDRQDVVRQLANEGRLRLTSSGVTTADTLLPRSEAILRDLLLGQEWLRTHGMVQEPRLAYFSDSFGCTPALPSLLRAAGFDRTALTRIDGMYFPGADYERARSFPRPGSSAARLSHDEKTLDFVWRDANGAEVLCHWNAFTYGQGDMLAHRGITRVYVFPLAIPDRSERHVAARIDGYARQLAPLSRTPYMLCPIGFDFVPPIPDLVALLDRYNRVRYPTTGLWAVNAGLDDYLALVEAHRDALPAIELDPNPYWTGFYASRPALKRKCHGLVESLLVAESLSLLPECREVRPESEKVLESAWWDAAASNHHDLVTGTSPNAVVEGEQLPWLERSAGAVGKAIQSMKPLLRFLPLVKTVRAEPPHWTRDGDLVRIETPHYIAELSERAGGCIVRAMDCRGDRPWLNGDSNDLISYRDSGGLWRMGHEFRGGHLTPAARASQHPAALQVQELGDTLEVACDSVLDGEAFRRWLWFRNESPLICGRVFGRAARQRTVTLSFATTVLTQAIHMGQPGGVVTRPARKLFDPTFWPVQDFAHVRDTGNGHGLGFCLVAAGAIACRPGGQIELVALRNATLERAWGFLPLPANPASGCEKEPALFEYGIVFTEEANWRTSRLPAMARGLADAFPDAAEWKALRELAVSQVVIETQGLTDADVRVMAFKPASRGEGLILRMGTPSPPVATTIRLSGASISAAFLCDARERDLEPLPVQDGCVSLVMHGSIATVRLLAN